MKRFDPNTEPRAWGSYEDAEALRRWPFERRTPMIKTEGELRRHASASLPLATHRSRGDRPASRPRIELNLETP